MKAATKTMSVSHAKSALSVGGLILQVALSCQELANLQLAW